MASKSKWLKHLFGGGWATDFGTSATVGVSQGGKVVLPWLNEAENVGYELDGGPRKMPGCEKNNAAALESGARLAGVFDVWFQGSSGTPAQHRVIHVGTKIKKDNADNTFTDLFTGMTAGAVPSYTMLEDILVMANDSGTDVPKSWDGTTAQNLAGTPPTFAFCETHKNRVWAAGDVAHPSRLYYCIDFDPEDWVGSGSGYIDVDPSDGDRITGIKSFRDELWVFKGPYKGSIHRILGSSPTGDDPFARKQYAKGIGAVNHNSIVPYGNDLFFLWSDGTARFLSATAQSDDFSETAVSRPINTWIRDHVNRAQLRFAQGVNWPEYGVILVTVPIDAGTVPNCVLMLDYRFDPPKWAKWKDYDMVTSFAQGVQASPTFSRVILAGSSDGYLRTISQATRAIDGEVTIPCNVMTPFIDYDLAGQFKTVEGASVCLNPKNNNSFTFGWTADDRAQQSDLLSQGGGGAVLGSFLLGTDVLGGARFRDVFSRLQESGGEFRSIQYQLLENTTGDFEPHSFSVHLTGSAESYENAA